MDGRMIDGWKDGLADERADGLAGRQTHRLTDKWTGGWMAKRAHVRTNRRKEKRTNRTALNIQLEQSLCLIPSLSVCFENNEYLSQEKVFTAFLQTRDL